MFRDGMVWPDGYTGSYPGYTPDLEIKSEPPLPDIKSEPVMWMEPHQGTSCEAGWAYEYGDGRVCFMAPGHMISALWNPEYVKLQKNAVRWLLREM